MFCSWMAVCSQRSARVSLCCRRCCSAHASLDTRTQTYRHCSRSVRRRCVTTRSVRCCHRDALRVVVLMCVCVSVRLYVCSAVPPQSHRSARRLVTVCRSISRLSVCLVLTLLLPYVCMQLAVVCGLRWCTTQSALSLLFNCGFRCAATRGCCCSCCNDRGVALPSLRWRSHVGFCSAVCDFGIRFIFGMSSCCASIYFLLVSACHSVVALHSRHVEVSFSDDRARVTESTDRRRDTKSRCATCRWRRRFALLRRRRHTAEHTATAALVSVCL